MMGGFGSFDIRGRGMGSLVGTRVPVHVGFGVSQLAGSGFLFQLW